MSKKHKKKKRMGAKAIVGVILFLLIAEQICLRHGMNNSFYGMVLLCMFIAAISYFSCKIIKRAKYKNCGIKEIDCMTGIQFENFLQYYFSKLGYSSEVTQASNDYGADLILCKKKEKLIVQAKRYQGKVGIQAVQEVIAANVYYGGTKPMVVTNSFFTAQAIELADKSNVELWDRNRLVSTLNRIHGKKVISDSEKEHGYG